MQKEVMSMFALTLAPFLGVLVGGGLIQLAFGWDAAPVRVFRGIETINSYEDCFTGYFFIRYPWTIISLPLGRCIMRSCALPSGTSSTNITWVGEKSRLKITCPACICLFCCFALQPLPPTPPLICTFRGGETRCHLARPCPT